MSKFDDSVEKKLNDEEFQNNSNQTSGSEFWDDLSEDLFQDYLEPKIKQE